MQQPKIDVQKMTLSQLYHMMHGGQLQIPRFQRDFVWPLTKTRALLDSMYKEFPIGTFFLWRATADSTHLIRALTELGIPEPTPYTPVSYILDGQQRLTSLYVTLQAIRLGSRDYGRISLDLASATNFAQNTEEDFAEELFVYRTADNERFVAVKAVIEGDFEVYNQLPDAYKLIFNRAHHIFTTFPFSVVWIQEQNLADAIEIFQRINQSGKKLSRYDLVCANVWNEQFDFRRRVTMINELFAKTGFGELHETIYTQTFALILHNSCKTIDELSLTSEGILRVWDKTVRALEQAVQFASDNLGVKYAAFLPYRGIIPVLAYYFYHKSQSTLVAKERTLLWQWFWRVTLSERYSSTSPAKMAEDAQMLRNSLNGSEVQFTYAARVTQESILRTMMTSTSSALRNAVLCMLSLQGPKNLKDGSPVNLKDGFFSDLSRTERHHIFPVGYLKTKGYSSRSVHAVANFCFIPANLNKEISSRSPTEYLGQYRTENPNFAIALASHLLPTDENSALWKDDFEQFLTARSVIFANRLNDFANSSPDILTSTVTVAPQNGSPLEKQETLSPGAIGVLEVQFRDFIDSRLTAVAGKYYWKQTMPGDIINHVKERIQEQISRHPYEDQNQYVQPRRRLDFCDVSHYEKIILRNWSIFEEVFRRRDQLESHMRAFRTLRNTQAHNRTPTDIEQQVGEAAIRWLQRTIERYEQELEDIEDETGDVD